MNEITLQPSPNHEWNGNEWVIREELLEYLIKTKKEELLQQLKTNSELSDKNPMRKYPLFERESFYRQELEARAFFEDSSQSCPLLSKLAEARGIRLREMCEKVLSKAQTTASILGEILANKKRIELKIERVNSLDELEELVEEINNF